MPCFNAERYVKRSLESVFCQTYDVKQIICVNDGSTDGTLPILKEIKDSGGAITIISQPNAGASAARNNGLRRVSAEYVQFLDSDDLLEPTKLEHQAGLIEQAESRPDLIAAASKSVFVDQPARPPAVNNIHPDEWTGLVLSGLGITSSNLWKTSTVRSVGAWDEAWSPSDDAELMFRMLKSGAHVLRDSHVLTTLQRQNDSLSNRDAVASAKAWLELRSEIYHYLSANDLLTPEREQTLLKTAYFRLHMLAEEEPKTAIKWHRELIPRDYIPDDPWLGLGRVYVLLYRLFGFSRAEQLHRYWLRLRRLFA